MSELTPCNFCTLRWIRKRAKEEGQRVVTRESTSELGGTNVFVLPPGVEMTEEVAGLEADDGDEFTKKYFTAWLMSLTDHCVC